MTTSKEVFEKFKEVVSEFESNVHGKTKKAHKQARANSLAIVKLLKQYKALNLAEEKELKKS